MIPRYRDVKRRPPREGCHASPNSSARRIARSELPPTQISGCGDGCGSDVASWNDQYSPFEVALAVPERAHQPDLLVGSPTAALELDAHEVELVLVPAHPDAERETAARELLQRRDLLRQVHRVVQRHEHDRGAEPDPFRPAGDPAENAAVKIDRADRRRAA